MSFLIQDAVSGALTNAQALAGTTLGDTAGAVRVLSDGANAGTRLRWFTPIGFSAPVEGYGPA